MDPQVRERLDRAVAQRSAGEREAVPYYERALAAGLTGEDRRGALLGLGSTYRALGRYDEALATLAEGAVAFPDDRGMRAFLALALHNAGRGAAAVSALLTMLLDTTSDPAITAYEGALREYAADPDRVWD
jgi:tetratricopeptide (TPR) repeat protein